MKRLPVTVVLLLVLETSYSLNKDSVLLRDVQALTFYKNRHTTARCSHTVPQLKCVGGFPGCHLFIPDVVQCVNRGWDGVDVQWECQTEMDNAYKFGYIEVNCEGYNHPDDDYILKGSCGLEYTLELTKEGMLGLWAVIVLLLAFAVLSKDKFEEFLSGTGQNMPSGTRIASGFGGTTRR